MSGNIPTSPIVSGVTTAYNTEPFIGSAIASVQAKTLADWELLVADDASTDRTTAIVEAAAAADPCSTTGPAR